MQEMRAVLCELEITSRDNTRLASWCRTVILVTEVSIHTSQPLTILIIQDGLHVLFVCLCLGFTAQSTTRSCRASQLIVVLFLGRLRPSKRLASTKRGRPWQ